MLYDYSYVAEATGESLCLPDVKTKTGRQYRNQHGNPWIEAAVETLKRGWAEGLSCSQIAKEIWEKHAIRVSRNAVIGKRSRLGLPGRVEASRTKRPKSLGFRRPRIIRAPQEPKLRAVPLPPPPQIPALVLADGSHATIATITDSMCKYGIGDPREPSFHFCGHATTQRYCQGHAQLCYGLTREPIPRRKPGRLALACGAVVA